MTRTTLKTIAIFVILGILSFTTQAADLQAFIQEGDSVAVEKVSQVDSTTPSSVTASTETSAQFTHIIELVVAGIVASALIISVLVLFLGRWAGRREKKIIKRIRIKAEEEQEHIIAAATTVREQEKETTKIVHKIRDDAKEFIAKKDVVENFDEDIKEITIHAKAKKQEIDTISETVNNNVEKIKSYWDEQLSSTVSTIQKVQGGLDSSLNSVDKNLDEMLQQKIQSDELLGEHLKQHNEQLKVINSNAVSSDKLNENLKETLKESNQLLKLLKRHQKSAEKSLSNFTQELSTYEEQAYEQFDTSFQVADLARQELNTNIEESRKHIETMRRHEEQSHSINTQTQKNLKSLDFTKIAKLSHTLDSTFTLFTDMSDKVDETRAMLDELNDLETDINKTTNTLPSSSPQLAKEVELIKTPVPSPLPTKIDLTKPKIEVQAKTQKPEVEVKPKAKKSKVEVKSEAQKTKVETKPKAQEAKTETKVLPKQDDIKTDQPVVAPIPAVAPIKDIITTKKATVAPKLKPTKPTSPEAKKVAPTKTKPARTPKKSAAKMKPITIKSKGTAKPINKPKENSIANSIEERVEIKSFLTSSEASKTAYKISNTDNNAPVSFFTNVKKNKPTKVVDEKKEPILGSMKRTIFGK